MEEVFLGLGEAATAVQWTPPTLPENLPLANEHKGVDNESAGDEKPWQNHLTGIASMCRQHASNTLGLEYWDAGDKAVLAAQPARTLRNMALAGDECRSWNGGGANDGWLPPLLTHASLHSDATTTLATVAAAGGGHGTGNGIGPSFLGNRTRRASSSVQSGHTSLLNKARKHEKELFPALKLPAAASLKREQVDSAALLEAMEAVSTWLGTSGPGNAWMDSGGPVLGASSSKRSLPPLAHSRSDAEFSLFLSPLSPSPTPFKSISAQSMNPGGPAQSSTGEGGGNETEEKTQQGPARASVGGSSGGGKDSARREATPPSEGVVDPDFMATTLPGGIASPIPPQPLPRNGSGGHGFSSRSQHRPSLEGPARATTGEAKPQTEAEAEGGPAAPQCVQLTVYGTQLVNGPWQPRAPLSYSLASTSSRSGSHSGPMRRLGSNSAIPLSWHNGDALSPSLGSMTFEESKRQMLGLKSKASQDATLPVSNFLPFRAAAPLLRSTELWAMGAEAVMGLWVKEVIRTHWASIGLPPSKQARKKARKKGMKRAYHSPYALQAFPEPLHHDPPQHTRFAGNALFTATTAFPMLKRGSLMEEKHGADEDPGHSHGLQPGTASLDTALSSWAASRMKAVQGTRQRFREYLVSMKAQPRVHVCALLHWLYDDIDSKDFEAKGRRLKALAAAAEHATASHCAPSHSLLKLLTLTAVPLLQRGGALSDRSLLALVWPLVQGIVEAVLRILELPASSRLVTVPVRAYAAIGFFMNPNPPSSLVVYVLGFVPSLCGFVVLAGVAHHRRPRHVIHRTSSHCSLRHSSKQGDEWRCL